MANYYGATRTNYFRVTDEEEYAKLYEGLYGCEDAVEDFSMEIDGIRYHGFGCYGSIGWTAPLDDKPDCDDLDGFIRELQKILPEDESFIVMESGHEKLRYVSGWVEVVTRKETKFEDLSSWAMEKARDMLGNPDFQSRLSW